MKETCIRVNFSCRVIAGHNLAKKDIFGASDPYLRIDLIDSREEVEDTVITKTKKRTLNPKVSINLLIVRCTHYLLFKGMLKFSLFLASSQKNPQECENSRKKLKLKPNKKTSGII